MICPDCLKPILKAHKNRKRCKPCALKRRSRPLSNLSPAQERTAKKWAGKIDRHILSEKIGVSRTALIRWGRENKTSLAFHTKLKNNPDFVKSVCIYYSAHGLPATEAKYPGVKIRSIVERYLKGLSLPPRQLRWTGIELLELARMGGLVKANRQAQFFNRPNAFGGSIKSVWSKVFKQNAGTVNGLANFTARHLVKRSCPFYIVPYQKDFDKHIVLWIDMAEHLKDDLPDHINSAVAVMAKFQRWLHGTNTKNKIFKIMERNDG